MDRMAKSLINNNFSDSHSLNRSHPIVSDNSSRVTKPQFTIPHRMTPKPIPQLFLEHSRLRDSHDRSSLVSNRHFGRNETR
eukprot:scaffold69055_cov35-Tisochrysis_lutea.AAC.4